LELGLNEQQVLKKKYLERGVKGQTFIQMFGTRS